MTQLNFTQQLAAFKNNILGLLPTKTRKDTKLYASDYGLIPNINTPEVLIKNSDILNNRILIPNPYAYVVLDQTSSSQETKYYIGKTKSRAYEEYCIDLIDFRGKLEWEVGVTLVTEKPYAGIQLNRILGENGCELINPSLDGQLGMWTYYRRGYNYFNEESQQKEVAYWNDYLAPTDRELDWLPLGYPNSYDTDWGTYKYNGINMWGTSIIRSGNIRGYIGWGISNFGHTQVRLNSTPIPIRGKIGRDRQYDNFIPDDQSLLQVIQVGVTLVINGEEKLTGGMNGNGVPFRDTDDKSLKIGTKVEAYYYYRGKNLMADSCVLDGINNISFCGAGGYLSTGDEANQYNISNLRIGNVGGPAICSSSLLRGLFIASHNTQTGEHFKRLEDGKWIFNMPSVTNREDDNGADTYLHMYNEIGNQRIPKLSWNSLVLGGINYEGMEGGHGFIHRRLKDVYMAGQGDTPKIEVGGEGLRFQWGDKTRVLTITSSDNPQLMFNGGVIVSG